MRLPAALAAMLGLAAGDELWQDEGSYLGGYGIRG
jgi:hypothetical protein